MDVEEMFQKRTVHSSYVRYLINPINNCKFSDNNCFSNLNSFFNEGEEIHIQLLKSRMMLTRKGFLFTIKKIKQAGLEVKKITEEDTYYRVIIDVGDLKKKQVLAKVTFFRYYTESHYVPVLRSAVLSYKYYKNPKISIFERIAFLKEHTCTGHSLHNFETDFDKKPILPLKWDIAGTHKTFAHVLFREHILTNKTKLIFKDLGEKVHNENLY